MYRAELYTLPSDTHRVYVLKVPALRFPWDVESAVEITITINSYMMESDDLGGKLAGFQINWSEVQKWEGGHPAAPPQGSEDGNVAPHRVEAMCW